MNNTKDCTILIVESDCKKYVIMTNKEVEKAIENLIGKNECQHAIIWDKLKYSKALSTLNTTVKSLRIANSDEVYVMVVDYIEK